MTEDDRTAMIQQNIRHIVQLEQLVRNLISALDLSISLSYKKAEAMDIATHLSNTLGQIDSDLAALIDLIID